MSPNVSCPQKQLYQAAPCHLFFTPVIQQGQKSDCHMHALGAACRAGVKLLPRTLSAPVYQQEAFVNQYLESASDLQQYKHYIDSADAVTAVIT